MELSAHWVSGHGGPLRGWLEKSGFDQAWWVFPELDAALRRHRTVIFLRASARGRRYQSGR